MRELTFLGTPVCWLDSVDSTSSCLRRMAGDGAPHGLALIAGEQTCGRGRAGRSFSSPKGKGLYLSVLLRPDWPAASVGLLTPWAAVAVCRAVETLTGLRPAVKWVNDVLLGGKKLCGILTEADIAYDGTLNWVILGIGINLTQCPEDFPPDVAGIATSLGQHLATPPGREAMAAALFQQLEQLWRDFPARQPDYLAAYRARCSTVGCPVRVHTPGEVREGFALAVEEDFSLSVRFADGSVQSLRGGEVTVRRQD